jgi:molybdopterin/thiamine biosynthesis adenylyltransferase
MSHVQPPGTGPEMRLVCAEGLWSSLVDHVLSDRHEHGGVLLCGYAMGGRSGRLLVRRFIPAVDGRDYVPSDRGHRALTAAFIKRVLGQAAQERLACVFVHGHGPGDSVGFSATDMRSHERGYPALLSLVDAPFVGAIVLATRAAAGDIWHKDGQRSVLSLTRIVGANIVTFRPEPQPEQPVRSDHDRQARVLGTSGLAALRSMRVGVVGVGGAGNLVVEMLSRVGVGELVTVDPDRITVTNVNRLTGARRRDALPWLTADARPRWLKRLGHALATRKTALAKRLARNADAGTAVVSVNLDVCSAVAAEALIDCDYIVLAADSQRARHLVNVLAHQYLIPFIQIGSKVQTTAVGGVSDIFSVARPVTPDGGCLRCSQLIDPVGLAAELGGAAAGAPAIGYGTGEQAPSVISLNGIASSLAATHVLLAVAGLNESGSQRHLRYHPQTGAFKGGSPRRDADCPVCGATGVTGLGDLRPLPLPAQARPAQLRPREVGGD